MKHWVVGKPKNIFVQFFRYFWVGGSSAVVDLIAYSILIKLVMLGYFPAAFIGYMCGLAWNYTISILWVFDSHDKSKEILLVFLIAIGGLLWTWLILYILITLGGLDAILAKMISQVIVLIWNFGMRKLIVFK